MNPHRSAAIITYSYQTQAVRDLAWACFSPPIVHVDQVADAPPGVSACTPLLTHDRRQWLEQLDAEPQALLQHLSARPTHRLGVYFEHLWHFFLQHDPSIELIAHNLPVRDAGRTLGEFDCLYYCVQRDCHVHLELAVKYFLGLPRHGDHSTAGSAHEWLGPDRRDRLETKLQQLMTRQILLGETPAAQRLLAERNIGDIRREIALKGYLFQPRRDAPPPPPGYNTARTLNHWVTCEELATYCATLNATAFTILPKMRWLARAHCNAPEQMLSLPALQAELPHCMTDDHYPLLVAALDTHGLETSRFFITPARWPNGSRLKDSSAHNAV